MGSKIPDCLLPDYNPKKGKRIEYNYVIYEYQTLKFYQENELDNAMNKLSKEGWIRDGNLIFAYDKYPIFIQVMKRKKNDSK
jgi:hypothetical protein